MTYDDRGNGVYVISASGLTGIEAVRFTLAYDPNVLTNPRVERGAFGNWMVFFPSIEKSGEVTVVFLNTSPNSGSGQLATIRFDKKTTTQTKVGFVYELTGDDTITKGETAQPAADTGTSVASGESVPVAGQAPAATTGSASATPSQPGSSTATTVTGKTTTAGVTTGTVALGETTVTMAAPSAGAAAPAAGAAVAPPPQAEPPRDTGPLVPMEEDEHVGEAAPIVEHKPVASDKLLDSKYTVYKGILERFRVFTGEKNPKNLMALFSEQVAAAISQEPPIALSDGVKTVTLKVDLGESGIAPNFALRGATLKSLSKDGGKWVVVVLPEARRTEAVLIIAAGERMIEYPLTVAPAVDVNIDKKDAVTEKDFILFLKERGTEKAPRFDLNGDGKRDYVDEFIFTANYLVAQGEGKAKGKKK